MGGTPIGSLLPKAMQNEISLSGTFDCKKAPSRLDMASNRLFPKGVFKTNPILFTLSIQSNGVVSEPALSDVTKQLQESLMKHMHIQAQITRCSEFKIESGDVGCLGEWE